MRPGPALATRDDVRLRVPSSLRTALTVSAALAACAAVSACEDVPPPPFSGVPDARDTSTRDTTKSDGTAADGDDDADADAADGDDDATILCREHVGDLTIATKADLAQLEYVRVLRGTLLMKPAEGLWNQSVREIKGSLRFIGTAASPVGAHVTLAAVSVIGGDLELSHTDKGLVDLFRLEMLSGSLVASDGGWAFWTPILTTIGGRIDVRDATHLAFTFDQLTSLGGPVHIERAAGLKAFSLGQVRQLAKPSSGDAIALVDNPDLTSLELGRLTAINGDVTITGNAKLPRVVIDTALTGVSVSGKTTICGNLDDEACP